MNRNQHKKVAYNFFIYFRIVYFGSGKILKNEKKEITINSIYGFFSVSNIFFTL